MITQSAKKAYRQNLRRRTRNLAQKTELKKVLKSYKKAASGDNLETAKSQLATVYKKLDKAAKTNLIKKNTASRLKSRLTALLNK